MWHPGSQQAAARQEARPRTLGPTLVLPGQEEAASWQVPGGVQWNTWGLVLEEVPVPRRAVPTWGQRRVCGV